MKYVLKAIMLILLIIMNQSAVLAQAPKKLPARMTESEKLLQSTGQHQRQVLSKTGVELPANIRYPGEFEESQAVAISWADGYDDFGNPTGNVDTTYEWGFVSAQLADAIQSQAQIWIRVNKPSDTIRVLAFMKNLGAPLYNYRFYITNGDGWWIRDFGPNGIYYGSKDSLAFIDLKYYPTRDSDDLFPKYLAKQLGIPNYISTLNGEGGNLMSDGFKRIFYSSMLTDENTGTAHSPSWSTQNVKDTMIHLFNAPEATEIRTLECDGGTGHIDLYLKMIDEQTIMVSQYPKEIKAQDKQIIEDNFQYLTTLKSTYNRPFRIFRIPHPTGDNGKYVDTTCNQINNDARTFVNGLTINKMFIYPSYSDGSTGNQAQTDSVTKLFKYIMPGYKIVPIDSRSISPYAGELHCITMQIPAENPVLFWHPSIDGLNPFGTSFHIIAKITNHSGIQTAVCKWRKKGAASWNSLNLTDSSGYFIGNISDNSLTVDDKIEYYLTATTVNGKTSVKPITAPEGYYTVYFKIGTGIDDHMVKEKNYLFGAYPNPAANNITIPYYVNSENGETVINIYSVEGRLIQSVKNSSVYGLNKLNLELNNYTNGIYVYTYTLNGEYIATRKFTIAK